jgi:dTDP-4-amino-4,6-dideoxygalactose transaminase
MMIDVTKSYLPEREKFKQYVDRVFDSGWLTNNGCFVQELQSRLCDYLGVKNMLLVTNGTMALQIAYKLLNLSGRVITTPFTFVATVSSQVWEGLEPIFADIDRDTFNIDPNLVEQAITTEVAAIVPVHVFGNHCSVEALDALARRYGIKVIYDAAHAFGIQYKGRSILDFGDISILSFHSTKVFHTIEGGALIIKDEQLYEKAKLMINFGIPGWDRIVELGINAKMNEFQAIMGLCVLDDLELIRAKRQAAYEYYAANLPHNLKTQRWNVNATNNYGYFPVVFESEALLLKVKTDLEKLGIKPRRYFYPSLEKLCYLHGRPLMSNSDWLAGRILCLPLFDSIAKQDQDAVIRVIRECLK